MASPSRANSTDTLPVEAPIWVDNPPPALPHATDGGASSPTPSGRVDSRAPAPEPGKDRAVPGSSGSFYPPYSIGFGPAPLFSGKCQALPSAPPPPLLAPRPVYPIGPPIPILRAGQPRTQPLPDKIPSDPPQSVSPSTSYPTLSPSPDADPDDGDDSRSTRTKPPAIRIRRVGALNISVSSDSDSSFSSRAAGRKRRRRRGEGSSSDEEESTGPSRELSGESSWRDSRGRPRVDEDQYRTIVDGLARQNHTLRSRLRKYEPVKMSAQMESERLFELRFFDSIPQDKRHELEGFLTRYVQGIAPLPTDFLAPAPTASSAAPSTAATFATSPPSAARPSLSAPLAPPTIPDRPPLPASRAHRHIVERERLAGPSNSGVEPASYTGTGSGMRVRYAPDFPEHFSTGRGSHGRALAQQDAPSAREIVRIVEKLFEDAIGQVVSGGPVSPPLLRHRSSSSIHGADRAEESEGEPNSTSNEAYLAHLLKHDLNQWQYLNLAIQMSRLLRFAVTPAFVRSAIRTFSTKLEVSSEGSRVRWVGGTSGRSAEAGQPEEPRTSSTESVQTEAGRAPSNGPGSVTGSRTESIAASSTQPSAQSSLLANSKFGTTEGGSTAATSISTSSQKHDSAAQLAQVQHDASTAAPHRPAPSVLQPSSHGSQHDSLVHSPEPLGLVSSAKQAPSRYVPYFGAAKSTRRAQASSAAASSISDGASDSRAQPEATALTSRQSSVHKPSSAVAPVGTLTFFANAPFCSDLSTNTARSVSAATSVEVEDETEVLGCATSRVNKDLPTPPLSPELGVASARLLPLSGMTEVVPADLFTVRVQTAYRPASPTVEKAEPLGAVGIAVKAGERKRSFGQVLRVDETREDVLPNKRRPLSAGELYDSSEEVSAPADSSSTNALPSGSTSGSSEGRKEAGAKRHGSAQADYLLSLAAPLYDWAPEGVSRSNLKRVQKHQGGGRMKARRGEVLSAGVRMKVPGAGAGAGVPGSIAGMSRFSGSVARSGEEAPISLSDMVSVQASNSA